MAKMRTFIAVDLEAPLRERCLVLQRELARSGCEVKWVERANFHLTLLFLGEVLDREIPSVCRAVAGVAEDWEPFSLSLQGVGCFPNPRRPRVVWAGIGQGQPELIALHAALEPPLLELGCYRREDRQYTPHMTLGRVEGEGNSQALVQAIGAYHDWEGGEMIARDIRVMSSELRREGPVYTVLSTIRFRGEKSRQGGEDGD